MRPNHYMVFDVESIGLHGEGFAVGFVVIDERGIYRDRGTFVCDPSTAEGSKESRDWVMENVPPLKVTHETPKDVRNAFWGEWRKWAQKGAVLVTDCGWPVEARFLAKCVEDDLPAREWEGPYPLHDLASVALMLGADPLATYDRLPTEPKHDPYGDARQSARILIEMLDKILIV